MKKVKLPYGRGYLEVVVPDCSIVIEEKYVTGIKDEKQAFVQALRNPIYSLPLREICKDKNKIAIVISDITRPTPNERIIPWIIEEISLPKEKFVIINGTGSHRENTKDELIKMLGKDIVDNIKIINHSAYKKEKLSFVGKTKSGTEIFLNSEYLKADLKIVTGFIEPHFFAGFSGGLKGIIPGIAGIDTIMGLHIAELIGNPLSTWLILDSNPTYEEIVSAGFLAKPDFLVNVSLNKNKEITGIFAGDCLKAHRKGADFVKKHSIYKVKNEFDIVITTNGGYPLDQNLYQTVKGMSSASRIVKNGGSIVVVSECSDGFPEHGNFKEILKLRKTPEELLKLINSQQFCMFDQWEAQIMAMILTKAKVYIYSSLKDEDVINSMLIPIRNIEGTLKKLIKEYSESSNIAILPQGPYIIPTVVNYKKSV